MLQLLALRTSPSTCSISNHNRFGPIADDDCYNGLDFTLFFEEAFMCIAPASIGIIWIIACIWHLRKQAVMVARGWLYWAKLVGYEFSRETLSSVLTKIFRLFTLPNCPSKLLVLRYTPPVRGPTSPSHRPFYPF